MPLTQDNRLLQINTPLGEDVLLLRGFEGTEGLSTLFSFELDLVSENTNIQFADIIGQNVTVTLALRNGEQRYFNGVISRFSLGVDSGENEEGRTLANYSATMVPWLWLLSRTSNSRIFQELTVPDIVERIFSEKGFNDFRMSLQGTYKPKEYYVQYQETDFNFISRILEQEGIYYFFAQEENTHTMVLADSPNEHAFCPNQEDARFHPIQGAVLEEDVITHIYKMQQMRISKYTVNDYNFKTPSTDLKVEVTTGQELGPEGREIYDCPAEYYTRSEGDTLANIRMQMEEAKITTLTGSGNCRSFAAGYRFRLTDHHREDMNDEIFVLTFVTHAVFEPTEFSGSEGSGASYTNNFTCIPFSVPFRPPLTTPKPIIGGVQTAIVVGPSGEEIHTDEHGRVKVQFHWDREGERNENSSCMVRVSQLWAGTGWGAMFIPRIGQEVIIDFIEGDPDRPIIVGRVYHGNNRPPYTLPDEKTKSTIKSDSSPGGGGFNEIRFEDKKGEEQLFIHAEKNQDIRTKEDRLEWVGKSSHLIVNGNLLEKVGGDKHLTIDGFHHMKAAFDISMESDFEIIQKAALNYALETGSEIHLKSDINVVIEAGAQLTLKVGNSFIVLNAGGVFIKGPMVYINSGGAPGVGSGASPETPELPREADTAEPGETPQVPPASPPPPTPQAQALTAAAENGTGTCET